MPPDLESLRRQLRERFPDAHQEHPPPAPFTPSSHKPLPSFPSGALSELSPAGPAAGLSLLLAELLQADTASRDHPLVLIDGRDSFDPSSYGADSCARLLWVRCHDADESLRCTDLLLRDGNLPFLILDLQLNPLDELRAIPTSSWYRLRNLARQSGAALLVFTPRHLLPCAALHLSLDSRFSLADLERAREELTMTTTSTTPAAAGSS